MAATESGKLPTIQFWDGADSLKFTSHLFEAIEELRLRRITDSENEEKIKKLVNEKHLLESDVESLKLRVKSSEEELELRLMDLRKNQELQLSDAQTHCTRLEMSLEVTANEAKMLREELRDLQLSKHATEKQIRDQERKIQQQNDTLENSFKQLTELDGHFQNVCRKVTALEEEQKRLARSMQDTVKTNSELAKIIKHQQAILTTNKTEFEKLIGSKLKGNVKSQLGSFCETSVRNQANEATVNLKFDLDAAKTANVVLTAKLKATEQEHQKTVTLLKDCHDLISNHVERNRRILEENSTLKKTLVEVEEQKNHLLEMDSAQILKHKKVQSAQQKKDQFVKPGKVSQGLSTDLVTSASAEKLSQENPKLNAVSSESKKTEKLEPGESEKVGPEKNEKVEPENLENPVSSGLSVYRTGCAISKDSSKLVTTSGLEHVERLAILSKTNSDPLGPLHQDKVPKVFEYSEFEVPKHSILEGSSEQEEIDNSEILKALEILAKEYDMSEVEQMTDIIWK